MIEKNNFAAIRISLASPETIRMWSHGEVTKAETINYRTLKPDVGGLFCERIFGPVKDWECQCGKYKKTTQRQAGFVCDKCHVEINRAAVRRERLGSIELAVAVSHILYLESPPYYLKNLLNLSQKDLVNVLYYAAYIVMDPGSTTLEANQVVSIDTLREAEEEAKKMFRTETASSTANGYIKPTVGIGAPAIKELLTKIDLNALATELREKCTVQTAKNPNHNNQELAKLTKRLEIVESFIASGNKPEWMILDVIPVLPPDLRPMVQLDGGRFASSDLNDLYRRIINRNIRVNKYKQHNLPQAMMYQEYRLLQEAVDALIDNGRRGRATISGANNHKCKSLLHMLDGKQGRFRQNLLGKRVDYSGRSVIVVGPELKMYQCGLPKEMALELFKPFVIRKLIADSNEKQKDGMQKMSIKAAKNRIDRANEHPEVWDALEEIIKHRPVLLNRAPTLHRLGVQAFEPILVEGKALRLHPLVCTAFNADFDGDQMPVHVPLSVEAQAEARFLMLASNNILKPQDGAPVVVPTQDMIIGCYYLTTLRPGAKGEGMAFSSVDEAIMAYQVGEVALQAPVKVRIMREWNGEERYKIIDTSVGRLIFNEAIPQNIGYVDRTLEENLFKLEIDFQVSKKPLASIVERCFAQFGPTVTSEVLDRIKRLGFRYSTRGGITIGYKDIIVPEEKKKAIDEAEAEVIKIDAHYKAGRLTNSERKKHVIEIWSKTTKDVGSYALHAFSDFNPVRMMMHSGARGNENQISQLAGMRGLMTDPSGQIIEVPIRSNFREGLSVLEFFVSSHGARKGLADTALRTSESGYLTRRLVDVSQSVIIREDDCFATKGMPVRGTEITTIYNGNKVVREFGDRIFGRYSAQAVHHPETGEVLCESNVLITADIRDKIVAAGITSMECRTAFTCINEDGICAKCYGLNLATGGQVDVGEAVGIIAAQAIGEPGTQLTMRTFHTGGVASASDITQGLPRVQEIFEARRPRGVAIVTEISGIVSVSEKKDRVTITPKDGSTEPRTKDIPYGTSLCVVDGQYVNTGDALTKGPIDPHDILRLKGPKPVQMYMLTEVQNVYAGQGVVISDKHIEIIIRQMMRKVLVESSGDTELLSGTLMDKFKFNEINDKTVEAGKKPPTVSTCLLGISSAALATESFLSAASFQRTKQVLAEAAVKGKTDRLIGLKENVMIGKLIPAGVGYKKYRDITVVSNEEQRTKQAQAAADKAAEEEKMAATLEVEQDESPKYDLIVNDGMSVADFDFEARLNEYLSGDVSVDADTDDSTGDSFDDIVEDDNFDDFN